MPNSKSAIGVVRDISIRNNRESPLGMLECSEVKNSDTEASYS